MNTFIVILAAVIVFAVGFLGFLAYAPLKGYRTIVFHAVSGVTLGAIPLFSQITEYLKTVDWTQYATPKTAPIIIMLVAVLGIVLRYATHGPVGDNPAQ